LDAIWKNELPEGLDPMTGKELRQSLRRGSFVWPFMVIQVLAAVAMAAEFQNGAISADGKYAGMLNLWLLANSGPFWAVCGAICVVIMPMTGLVLMGQELEEGNHELLLLTKLNRWKVVKGKFIALWGLCALTFLSLLPYVVVRYLVGGVEWGYEFACAATVLGTSAVLCAGAIGASAFPGTGRRVAVLFLFLGSTVFTCGVPLAASAAVGSGFGWFYHLTAISAVVYGVACGLALGRSQLRLGVFAYEVKPGGIIIGLLVFAPFISGMLTAVTCGICGFAALLLLVAMMFRLDRTPQAPKWAPPALPDVPGGVPVMQVNPGDSR
jgi:ABC-type transport system involved in multi-copper enzyme maturation permease subunit